MLPNKKSGECQGRNDRGVVGRLFVAARLLVDDAGGAALDQRRGQKDMIDA
jgi:hypothetical protein